MNEKKQHIPEEKLEGAPRGRQKKRINSSASPKELSQHNLTVLMGGLRGVESTGTEYLKKKKYQQKKNNHNSKNAYEKETPNKRVFGIASTKKNATKKEKSIVQAGCKTKKDHDHKKKICKRNRSTWGATEE